MRKGNPWGLLVLAVGVLLLLNAAGIETSGLWNVLWPVVVMLCGFFMCYSARRVTLWGMLVALVGAWWLLARLNVFPEVHWGVLGGVAVIAVGLQMLFSRRDTAANEEEAEQDGEGERRQEAHHAQTGGFEKVPDGTIHINAVLWGDERSLGGEEFQGGTLRAVLGGIDLSLMDFSRFAPEAQLDVTCVLGGVELTVPKNVRVVNEVNGVFGGVEIKGTQSAQPVAVLRLCGSCVLGGLEIRLA